MSNRLEYLSTEAQDALDLAKRAAGREATLTPELLLAAACRVGSIADDAPKLAKCVPKLKSIVGEAPDEVQLADGLRPVFRDLSRRSIATLEELVIAVAESEAGRDYLLTRGLSEADLSDIVSNLKGKVGPLAGAATGGAAADGADSGAGGKKGGGGAWRSSAERKEIIEALSTFGRMLTVGEPPHKGAMRMDRYLGALQKSLLKMRRPSVIVIGQPGTGKTALVYEFARLIVAGDPSIAESLRDRDIFELSPAFLKSGASMVGQYEERVTTLIKLLEANPQIILFVDEVHSLLQSGMHERTPFSDANESFKTAVGRGGFSLIGATTLTEYRHHIAPDGALARRFGLVKVEPPTPEEAIAILAGRVEQFRRHYAPLRIPDEILPVVVRMTEDLVPARFQPDKSLELLDEACALCILAKPALPEVTEDVLVRAIEDSIGHAIVQPGSLTHEAVVAQLREKIVGQDAATDAIARAFVAGLSKDWLKHDGPRRVFFFCGPTGVGKTETASLLSNLLGGGREAIIRVDCNTLQGSASEDAGPVITRLLGVPRGYIGYTRGEGGLLSRIRDTPECIVLFDEIEKASAAISRILLQILDEGHVEDADGNLLDFRRAFIIFTTNAGTTYDAKAAVGFQSAGAANHAGQAGPTVSVEAVKSDLRARGYGEEFFGRHIDFIAFEALERGDIEVVLRRQLERLHDTAELRGYDLEWSPEVFAHLLSEWTPRFGARWVFTILRNRILEQLALADAQGELTGVTRIVLARPPKGDGTDAIAGFATRQRDGETLTVIVS